MFVRTRGEQQTSTRDQYFKKTGEIPRKIQGVYFIIVLWADFLKSVQIGFSGLLEKNKQHTIWTLIPLPKKRMLNIASKARDQKDADL